MRSAFICVFFALIIRKEGSHAAGEDFRPTPIPLNEWHDDSRQGRAATLHETFRTESPPTTAIIPAHYWEDALRHSVYLTLVRDKIDQLIAKGNVISPNTKPDQAVSKEIDDHDLWEKIKSAPFDRRPEEELASIGDVTIMARGRLLEEKNGFRFTEDESSKEKCAGEKCMDGVKAIWSVKRVRQRDQETSPGRYHYELTFSVISQTPKKQKKPHDNPIRTFTVRESTPERITDAPQEFAKYEKTQTQATRPERAVWIHKNITPTKYHLGRSYYHGLDRIFSSLFSDYDETPQEASARYKPNSNVPQVYNPQYSKSSYVGASTERHQQNVKYMPYPYKQPIKHSRPVHPVPPYPHPLPQTPQHYFEGESSVIPNVNPYIHNSNSYPIQTDYKGNFQKPSIPPKTTRPAVLPTPLPPITPTNDMSFEVTNIMKFGNDTTFIPETITVYKNYDKFRAPPGKVNYFPEQIRPPIYNAPPGVFVTMDKKPFKPMPPLKMTPNTKPLRNNRPIDFRPSPQIQDNHNLEPNSFSDTAFRPITTSYFGNNMNYTENGAVIETFKKMQNKIRNTHSSVKKPLKKPEKLKSEQVTTTTPDIITAASVSGEDTDNIEWANILGAFSKTTPMASPTERVNIIETTTPLVTTSPLPNTKRRLTTTTTTEAVQDTSTSTTPRPKKRTRPPPKFIKQDKLKNHKRRTTTTTTNTPEKAVITRPTKDLIPEASSAALSSTRSLVETTSQLASTTSSRASTTTTPTTTTTKTTPHSTTTTTLPTTTKSSSTTASSTISTNEFKGSTTTTRPRSKNRFRQSTLMQKGTSVNHDKWSVNGIHKNQTISNSGVNYPYRRKGSNFQGYVSSPRPSNIDESRERKHADRGTGYLVSTTTVTILKSKTTPQLTTTEQTIDEDNSNSESTADHNQEEEYEESEEENNAENDEDETKDHAEYIFQSTQTSNYQNNEVVGSEESLTTEQVVVTSPHSAPKNKTKCKKKKHNTNSNSETPIINKVEVISSTTSTTTTEKSITADIFQDLLKGFNFGGTSVKDNEISSTKPDPIDEESENHEKYLKIDDDFKDFLDNLGEKKNLKSNKDDEEQYDDNDDDDEDEEKVPSVDDEDSEFVNEDENDSGRNSNDDNNNYEDYQDRPYSFLELLAME